MRCEICLKSGQYGNRRSHSMRATKHRFDANVHKMTVTGKDGKSSRVKMCTRCLRTTMKPPRKKKSTA
ncbi:MAG: 50S ribosomal protein L28 [SAR202 cluster bacterium]|nr:50S ribosomal protein L28 [SAR202 cluster bacterium]MQG26706.1 50S ribosomal protein L28 [SAR202 cluster bacterium]MQG35152.1 50S ribosomal protein L28 [SAR202 cluster bacterium]MQG53154.1 50S ribosomal protein L28 [SAR202 cluster bacterium]MQG85613.1 50S ribosomal protein L28 [SAR202 cluster bacterium]